MYYNYLMEKERKEKKINTIKREEKTMNKERQKEIKTNKREIRCYIESHR